MTLSIARQTEIIEEEVNRALTTLRDEADHIFPDDGMPGDVALKGQQRDSAYLAMVEDWGDYSKVLDPRYEESFRLGVEQPPVSPRLLALLRVPGEFTKVAKEIQRITGNG
jgi:hypothetical protein